MTNLNLVKHQSYDDGSIVWECTFCDFTWDDAADFMCDCCLQAEEEEENDEVRS